MTSETEVITIRVMPKTKRFYEKLMKVKGGESCDDLMDKWVKSELRSKGIKIGYSSVVEVSRVRVKSRALNH